MMADGVSFCEVVSSVCWQSVSLLVSEISHSVIHTVKSNDDDDVCSRMNDDTTDEGKVNLVSTVRVPSAQLVYTYSMF